MEDLDECFKSDVITGGQAAVHKEGCIFCNIAAGTDSENKIIYQVNKLTITLLTDLLCRKVCITLVLIILDAFKLHIYIFVYHHQNQVLPISINKCNVLCHCNIKEIEQTNLLICRKKLRGNDWESSSIVSCGTRTGWISNNRCESWTHDYNMLLAGPLLKLLIL